MANEGKGALLFLFSSNIRPLYEQDILDILAAPVGLRYRFRYDERYINEAARRYWHDLSGTKVVVHFSLQQEARYHRPAFFPIRTGIVSGSSREANLFFVEFTLEKYASLRDPPKRDGGHTDRAHWVSLYGDYLERKAVGRPYEYSASLGPNLLDDPEAPLDMDADSTALFQRTSAYLCRTDSFRKARFVRFVRLAPQGAASGDAGALTLNRETNTFDLIGGATYELAILQAQPTEVTEREPFVVKADGETVKVIGREGFDVASRYDIIEVPIHALHPGFQETRETVLVVEPGAGIDGPTIRLPLRVRPPRRMGAVAAASSVLLMVVAVPALLPNLPLAWKVLLVVAGAFGANLLWLFAPSGRMPLTPRGPGS